MPQDRRFARKAPTPKQHDCHKDGQINHSVNLQCYYKLTKLVLHATSSRRFVLIYSTFLYFYYFRRIWFIRCVPWRVCAIIDRRSADRVDVPFLRFSRIAFSMFHSFRPIAKSEAWRCPARLGFACNDFRYTDIVTRANRWAKQRKALAGMNNRSLLTD